MKVLVISDSHNYVLDSHIEKIKQYGKFHMLIHCGDKYNDGEKYADKLKIIKIAQVPGNCDFNSHQPHIVHEVIEGKNILITHGHLHNVKANLVALKSYAMEKNVDAVVYGHTHCAQNEVIDNILFFNPGSTMYPKCGKESFGILEITSENISGTIIAL